MAAWTPLEAFSPPDGLLERPRRPFETLLGGPSKAKEMLGWEPRITVQEMCKEMVEEDYKTAQRYRLLKEYGFELPVSTEN